MQFNLVGVGTREGKYRREATSHWLADLALALVETGERVDWWYAEGERFLVANPALEGEQQREDESVAATKIVHRRVAASRLVTTMMQSCLLPHLRRHGEAAVVGEGLEVAGLMVALDQRLRAAGVRGQTILVWLAPPSLDAGAGNGRLLDWEHLKRACSIVAPNPNVRQELTARRVGSFVIEPGADGARRFVKDHVKHPGAGARAPGVRAAALECASA